MSKFRHFTAAEARSMRLVDCVVPEDEPEQHVRGFRAIAANAQGRRAQSEDFTEGSRSFMEKREPVFKGGSGRRHPHPSRS